MEKVVIMFLQLTMHYPLPGVSISPFIDYSLDGSLVARTNTAGETLPVSLVTAGSSQSIRVFPVNISK